MVEASEQYLIRDFNFDEFIVELRYEHAYLFWDRSGSIFQTIKRTLQAERMELRSANPGSVVVSYGDSFEIVVEPQRFVITCIEPEYLSEFLDVAKPVFEIVNDFLEFDMFLRVGFRQIFSKKFDTFTQVKNALQKSLSRSVPEGLVVDDNAVVTPSLSLRIENEYVGSQYHLHGIKRTPTLAVPIRFQEYLSDLTPKEQNVLLLDVDSYTKQPIDLEQLSLQTWILERHDLAKQNGDRILKWTT